MIIKSDVKIKVLYNVMFFILEKVIVLFVFFEDLFFVDVLFIFGFFMRVKMF